MRLPEFLLCLSSAGGTLTEEGVMSAQGGRLSAPHLTRGERQAGLGKKNQAQIKTTDKKH